MLFAKTLFAKKNRPSDCPIQSRNPDAVVKSPTPELDAATADTGTLQQKG